MTTYVDYIIYSQDEEALDLISKSSCANKTGRDGHYLLLVRTKKPLLLPHNAELLAQGHCEEDCPFSKLTGEQLEKYKLAYDTEPYTILGMDDEEEIITPPFKFGVFL